MPFDHLTGPGDGSQPHPVGTKYDPNGRPIRFAGNTIIAHVTHTSPVFAAIVAIQDRLRSTAFGKKFAFLPPSSLHMTVFEGVNDPEREVERWPTDIALDAPLPDVTSTFIDRLDGFEAVLPLRVRPVAVTCHPRAGSHLRLEGADADEEARLRDLRNRFSEALRHSKPNHHDYVWHITLSYLVDWLTDSEAREIEHLSGTLFGEFVESFPEIHLDRCDFCVFDTMEWFEPVKRLG